MTTDHFSARAPKYRQLRPTYPGVLFTFLASQCQQKDLVWEAGCGSGQATYELANHFKQVHATDLSQTQIDQAPQHPLITYQAGTADKVGLPSQSCDLACAAQAIHWFDRPSYFQEVDRVLNPNGILAFWTYSLARVDPEVNKVIDWFYHEVVGPYWPPERALVEEKYDQISFPYKESPAPKMTMSHIWTMEHFAGYLETWSASILYLKHKGKSPLEELQGPLALAWSDQKERTITWQLHLRWGRKS